MEITYYRRNKKPYEIFFIPTKRAILYCEEIDENKNYGISFKKELIEEAQKVIEKKEIENVKISNIKKFNFDKEKIEKIIEDVELELKLREKINFEIRELFQNVC